MKTYTYVLKDRERNLYKVGKTTNPKSRFRQLCIPGELEPIKLFAEDIEKELHDRYKEFRLKKHPVYNDGKTEYFSYGGKFAEFIDDLDTDVLPFYTPHNIVLSFEKFGKLRFDTVSTKVAIVNEDYYQWKIGRAILVLLGYVYYNGFGFESSHYEVEVEGSKLFITNSIVETILDTYTIDIVSSDMERVLYERKNQYGLKLYSRKVGTTEFGNPIFLVLTQIKK
ncbi:MAG: GIY-YIG nuclease family protein [Chlamydiia bacterium]|nr:GIY-YIG nuclease family protein [Chlamydiia bacterium]